MAARELVQQEILVDAGRKLIVTPGWCKACGICIDMCTRQVLGAQNVTHTVVLRAPEKCNGCGLCELICPDYVFTLHELEADP
jgi:indolepyruvate ferredoxin oxidoreductase beta subunit